MEQQVKDFRDNLTGHQQMVKWQRELLTDGYMPVDQRYWRDGKKLMIRITMEQQG